MPRKPKNHTGLSLFSLWLITFIDLIGVGIIIPILPVIFFTTSLVPAGTSVGMRIFLAAVLIASYPLSQFFGAPMLGALSDRHGRKPILLISLAGTAAGYVLFALGLAFSSIALLFASRILDGITGGNISVVRSAIADVSSEKDKLRNFGLIGMAFGAGFVLGPFIGGKLTDSSLVPWFSMSTPFWFAFLLVLCNLALVWFAFGETLTARIHRRISIFTGIAHIRNSLAMPNLRGAFLSLFLFNFGWAFYTQFFQIFLYRKFNFSPADIGTFFAYVGVWIIISQGGIVRRLPRSMGARQILPFSTILTSLLLLVLLVPSESFYLYLIIPFVSIFVGLTMPSFSALLSGLARTDQQGEILGIQQSYLSLAIAVPALVEGFLSLGLETQAPHQAANIPLGTNLPVLLASATIFIGWLAILFLLPKKNAA